MDSMDAIFSEEQEILQALTLVFHPPATHCVAETAFTEWNVLLDFIININYIVLPVRSAC